jgi:PBP1b-binding outer membrane lipoprotein LpoB
MRSAAALLALLPIVAGCAEESAPKEAEKAAVANAAEDAADAVKLEKKSIEEAAEAAVKLVEEESRQEIEGLAPSEAQ